MFKKLFGETELEQLQYLQWRALITLSLIAILIVALIMSLIGIDSIAGVFGGIAEMGIAIIMLFIWGWGVIKRLFGIVTIGAIFSNNIVIGVILFILYFMLAYFLGIIVGFIGTCRFVYLKVKLGKAN